MYLLAALAFVDGVPIVMGRGQFGSFFVIVEVDGALLMVSSSYANGLDSYVGP